ncbi:hypothetical protein V6N13_040357 [Hibiscus sabdariffa]
MTTFSFRFLGVIHAGGCLFCHGDTGSHVTGSGKGRGTMMRPHPLPLMFDNTFTGRSARQVQWTSRDITGSEPPTSPRSEHFTRPFNRWERRADQPGSIPSRCPFRMVLNALPRQGRGHNGARASFVSRDKMQKLRANKI